MSPLATSRAQQPYQPQPPIPQHPGTEPGLPEVHVNPPLVYVEATFEYRQLSRELPKGPITESELNELGREGWELVSVLSDGLTAHFYFKRLGR